MIPLWLLVLVGLKCSSLVTLISLEKLTINGKRAVSYFLVLIGAPLKRLRILATKEREKVCHREIR